jgi:hypothetical protein
VAAVSHKIQLHSSHTYILARPFRQLKIYIFVILVNSNSSCRAASASRLRICQMDMKVTYQNIRVPTWFLRWDYDASMRPFPLPLLLCVVLLAT